MRCLWSTSSAASSLTTRKLIVTSRAPAASSSCHGCRSQGLRRSAGHRPGLRSFAVAGVAPTNARFRNTCAARHVADDAQRRGCWRCRRFRGRRCLGAAWLDALCVSAWLSSTTSVPPRQRSLGASPQPLLAPRIAKRVRPAMVSSSTQVEIHAAERRRAQQDHDENDAVHGAIVSPEFTPRDTDSGRFQPSAASRQPSQLSAIRITQIAISQPPIADSR